MIINCLVCDKSKYFRPSQIKNGEGKYCSRSCYLSKGGFRKGVSSWIKGRHPLGRKWTKEQKTNQSVKMIGNRNGKGNKGRIISSDIIAKRLKTMKGKYIGEKHWSWKGGITRKHYGTSYIERRRFQREMQKMVFERDNYTCQMCGQRGVDLQVDHIQSWAEYVELRFSMDNCRTLCAKCHYQITFGRPMPDNIKGWGHNLLKARVLK